VSNVSFKGAEKIGLPISDWWEIEQFFSDSDESYMCSMDRFSDGSLNITTAYCEESSQGSCWRVHFKEGKWVFDRRGEWSSDPGYDYPLHRYNPNKAMAEEISDKNRLLGETSPEGKASELPPPQKRPFLSRSARVQIFAVALLTIGLLFWNNHYNPAWVNSKLTKFESVEVFDSLFNASHGDDAQRDPNADIYGSEADIRDRFLPIAINSKEFNPDEYAALNRGDTQKEAFCEAVKEGRQQALWAMPRKLLGDLWHAVIVVGCVVWVFRLIRRGFSALWRGLLQRVAELSAATKGQGPVPPAKEDASSPK